MPIISAGSSQAIDLGANDTYTVSTAGECYVDLLAGAPGSPYSSPRIVAGARQFGPYGTPAKIRVRAVQGDATYRSGGTDLVPVFKDPATGGIVDKDGQPVSGAGISQAETVFPDELVSLSATGGVCGAPCYISRIRCTLGSGVVLTVFEGAASTATPLLTATLSAGQEATIPGGKLRAINGVRAVFASGAFDFYIGTEA